MEAKRIKSFLLNKEVWLHVIVWILFFASINVNWSESWIAESFLPESVAPHIAIIIPIIFLLNVFWLIPNYFSKKKWLNYIWLSLSLLLIFEIVRAFIFAIVLNNSETFITTFKNELFGENSLIFGLLNFLVLNFVFYSFVYRFTRDWLKNQSVIETLKFEKQQLQLAGHSLFSSEYISEINCSETNEVKTNPKTIKTTLIVKKRNGVFLLKVSDVVYFQAQGDFVFAFDIYGNKHIVNESLKKIKNQVCEHHFHQINRSEIINFNNIIKFDSYTKNRLAISFKDIPDVLYTSNSRTPEFRLWIENH